MSSAIISEVMQAAEATYPYECCGLLIGQNRQNGSFIINEIVPSPNVTRGNQRDNFEIDPQVRFNVMRKLTGCQKNIIGHYHSHPNRSSNPSKRDFDMALEPKLVWVIIAVKNGLAQRPQAHIVDMVEKRFQEVEIYEFN